MAFNVNNLSLRRRDIVGWIGDATSPGQGTTIQFWGYVTADTAATVEAANYFNSGAANFNKGDVIQAVMVLNGTPVLKQYVVTSATGAATVVIALQSTSAG